MSEHSRSEITAARRWVVKVGSALLTANGRGLDDAMIEGLVAQLVALRERGLAGVLRALGRTQSASDFEASALDTFQTQYNRDPSNETNITDLAVAHRRYGRLLMEAGELEAAREHQGAALELLQPIVDRPQILTWQSDEYRALILEPALNMRFVREALPITEPRSAEHFYGGLMQAGLAD